ncbi:MAG TPA: BamA/TamA family outer membrane protein [Elusimicrobiota bacterium]|nr:BamA/TamA family outer membrane protein [Elusimicrobiota bacterium]
MKLRALAAAAVLLAAPAVPASARKSRDLCPRVRFSGARPKPKLTEVEKRLLCGDPGSDGWKNVSLPQARGFMTAFLQARGHHFPRFETDGDTLVVDVGTATVVRKLTGAGLAGAYDLGKRRKVVGELLTPSLLDKTKKGVEFELRGRGYACPAVVVTADARTGEVHVDAEPGESGIISGVAPARVPKVDPEVFRRYEAYEPGVSPYDIRLLSLTGDRIKQDQLFLSAYYDTDCSTAGAKIVQRVVEGPPFLVTVGVGADTEGLLIGKLRLQQSRLGARASEAEADVYASRIEQSLDLSMHDYLGSGTRLFLMPDIFVRREDEVNFDAAHGQVSLQPGWSRDGKDLRVEVRGGPAYDRFSTLRGLGPSQSNWFEFVTHAQVMTHLYEYYQRDPRRGWTATLDTSHRFKGLESDVNSQRLEATGEALWNLGDYEPPLGVLATRGRYGTTLVGGPRENAFTQLPPTDRFFLGGDADMRGFQRKRLPDDGAGFLTAAYEGIELRAGDVLPANIQPFVFIDAAMAGTREFELDPDVYYSPGVGLRWASPLGSIRGSLGRGLTWVRGSPTPPQRPGWQLFLSFGKEF